MAGRSNRGFAAMNPQKQREIARKGGQAAHEKKTAHEFTPEEARIAGRRGGAIISQNRAHMAAIGRKGGQSLSSGTSGGPTNLDESNKHQGGKSINAKQHNPENVTDLIKADHERVNDLFHQYELAIEDSSRKAIVAKQICRELEIHAQLEEEIFYPAVQSVGEKEKQCIDEGMKEHQAMKDLIKQLQSLSPTDASYDSTLQELRACVNHHIVEEENTVFPQAKEGLEGALENLGAQMKQRKQQLLGAVQPQEQPQQVEEYAS
jgi:general stress protein YciG